MLGNLAVVVNNGSHSIQILIERSIGDGKKSGNFGLNSNGKVIFKKFHSEIVDYLHRYSSFSNWNVTAEISLPFAKVSSFQSLISQKQYRKSNCKW